MREKNPKIRFNDFYLSYPWRQQTIAGQENKGVNIIEIVDDERVSGYFGTRALSENKRRIKLVLESKRMVKIPFLPIYIFINN